MGPWHHFLQLVSLSPSKSPKLDKVNVEKAMKTYVVNKYGRSKKDELGAVLRWAPLKCEVETGKTKLGVTLWNAKNVPFLQV